MRRLLIIIGIIIFLIFFGYFTFLNNHKVTLGVYGSHTLQLSLWVVISVFFLLGFGTSWLYQFFFHPERIIQKTKTTIKNYQNTRYEEILNKFQNSYLQYDFKAVNQIYNKLKRSNTLPLHIRVKKLELQRFKIPHNQLMTEFQELKKQFPHNLQVLLPYQKLAIDSQEWGTVELISQEILTLHLDHPAGLEGLQKSYQAKQDWENCIKQETQLLSHYPDSMVSENLLPQHEVHLLKRIQNDPSFLQQMDIRHLPNKSSFKEFHHISLILGQSEQLSQSGQVIKAAKLLQKGYEKTGAPVLLDQLEKLYMQSDRNEKIFKMFQSLKLSANSNYVELVIAKIYYQTGQLDQASQILNEVGERSSVGQPSAFHNLSGSNQTLPFLFSALKYLIARQQNDLEQKGQVSEQLIEPSTLLNHLYQCQQCGETGDWQQICFRCNHTYSYRHRTKLF